MWVNHQSKQSTEWMAEANCRDLDTNLFFPERHQVQQIKEAKLVCFGCKVRAACLEYGLSEKVGVFGGLTENERRKLRRQRRNTA